MTVIEWLDRVRKLDELINAKLAERDQWLTLSARLTSEMDGMPHVKGAVSDPVCNSAVRLVELAKETDRLVDRYVDHKQHVIHALEQLSAREYAVMHRIYIKYMSLDQVAEDLKCSTMTVWRIQQKALKNLQNVIDCYTT